jgi:hypothetical protein
MIFLFDFLLYSFSERGEPGHISFLDGADIPDDGLLSQQSRLLIFGLGFPFAPRTGTNFF